MSTDGEDISRLIVDLIESGYDAEEISRAVGIEADIAERMNLFRRSGEHRLLMRTARRAGISFSEAAYRWDTDDLVAELAWDALLYEEAERRCPNGHDPNDVEDVSHPKGRRPLRNGRLRVAKEACFTCQSIASVEKDMSEAERNQGAYVRLRPRKPGEPFKK